MVFRHMIVQITPVLLNIFNINCERKQPLDLQIISKKVLSVT